MSNPQTGTSFDLEKRSAMQQEVDALLGNIAVKLIGNEKTFNRLLPVLQRIMSSWAGKNPIKKIASRTALSSMTKMVKSLGSAADGGPVAADLGRLMELQWEIKADMNREDPHAGAGTAATVMRDFLENADFGAWKEMVESAGDRQIIAAKMMNDVVIDHIGKPFVLLSALPFVLDKTCAVLKDMLEIQMEIQPPDILFEAIGGIWDTVDGEKIGEVLNLIYMFAARFSVGSHLAGDGVKPAIQILVARILEEITSTIDPQVFADMKIANEENKAAVKNGVSWFLRQSPEFARSFFVHKASLANIRFRTAKERLEALDSLPDMEDVVREWAQAFDPLEFADLASTFLELVNIVHEDDPELIPKIFSGFFNEIDISELTAAGDGVLHDCLTAIRPAAAPLMPVLINGLCDFLTPTKDTSRSDLDDALARLKNILGG